VGLCIICVRLFYLQVLQITDIDPDYILLPRASWRAMPASRGKILDRNGVVLAQDRPVRNLAVSYRHLEMRPADEPDRATYAGVELWLDEACRITGRDRDEVLEKRRLIVRRVRAARRAVDRWRAKRKMRRIRKILEEIIPHTLMRDISFELVARVEANPERFPGVVIRVAPERHYPGGELAAHTLGYVIRARRPKVAGEPIRDDPTIVPGDRIGESGAEQQFDRWLRGRQGYYELDTDRKTGEVKRNILFNVTPGRTIYLTLDVAAQEKAEQELAGKGTGGAVVVIDVRNGEVLVLASSPTYDNNDLAGALAAANSNPASGIFLSRAIRGMAPPGSVIKPIVALAGAEKGTLRLGTRFTCAREQRFGGRNWHCTGRHGSVNMVEAIERSCNIWFYNAGLRAGPQAITALAWQLHWGRKTGIDLPFEASGRLPRPDGGWYGGNTMNLSIGQGRLLVTPLQVAVSMAAIANGGVVHRPHLLLKIEPSLESDPVRESYVVNRLDLSQAGLNAVREGMRRVPGPRGTARETDLHVLGAAAKTGTAQIANTELNHTWIVGYAPHDQPRYAFAVVVYRTAGHGAEVAGPIATATLESLLDAEYRGTRFEESARSSMMFAHGFSETIVAPRRTQVWTSRTRPKPRGEYGARSYSRLWHTWCLPFSSRGPWCAGSLMWCRVFRAM
jgi:penicillin-binding protein 2